METIEYLQTIDAYLKIDLSTPMNFIAACAVIYFFVAFRYFLIVSPFQLFFYKFAGSSWQKRKIYKDLPGKKEQIYEIKWSLITSLIFAVVGVFIGLCWQLGYTQIYLRFDDYPLWYMPVSFLIYLLVHDTYFYWSHRMMHHPKLYRTIHGVHHKSLYPSGWASFSFHPIESVIEAIILPLMLFFIPIHPTVFIFHLTFMTLTAVSNHLGFELIPKWGKYFGLPKYFIAATHHSQHHRYVNYNYGLYFTFWDRWMGTNYKDFDKEIKQRLS
ncbi:MAG: sterol desaturase family protein [Bdellovibrionales bacterium]